MVTHFSFTKKKLTELNPPSKNRVYIYDQKVNGLGLAITAKGTKSYFVYRKINGIPKRISLGKFPDLTIEQARKAASKLISQIADGIDPAEEKKEKVASQITLKEVFDEYLVIRKDLKPGTILDYKKALNETMPDWLNKPVSSITEDMVLARHKKRGLSSEARANNAMRVLRALLNFAKVRYKNKSGKPLMRDNPVVVLSQTKAWFKVERRKSYINRIDLPKWFNAVQELTCGSNHSEDETIRDYLLFLLHTGCRRSEALCLRWNEVCLDSNAFTLIDTKNSETVTLPISSFVNELLSKRCRNKKGTYVFSRKDGSTHISWPERQLKKVIEKSDVHFTIHDLRRTFITIGESLDISHYTLKRLVNHKSIESQDVTAGYIIPNMERLRKATQQITDYILDVSNYDESSRIVSIEQAKICN